MSTNTEIQFHINKTKKLFFPDNAKEARIINQEK